MSDIENVENNGLKKVDSLDGKTSTKTNEDILEEDQQCDLKENGCEKATVEEGTGRASSPRALWRYSKEEILKLRETPASKLWPVSFSEDFKNEFGKWDPEAWHQTLDSAKRCASPVNAVDRRREQLEDGIVLSPQRRSFGHGCQAPSMPQQIIPERPKSGPVRNGERDFDGRSRLTGRVGRGKNLDYRDRSLRTKDSLEFKKIIGRERDDDRHRDSRDSSYRYNGRDKDFERPLRREIPPRKHSQHDEEPEWMTFGPTSQSQTIELVGFEGKLVKKKKDKEHKVKDEEAKEKEIKNTSQKSEETQEKESEEDIERKENIDPKESEEKVFDINDLFRSENLLPPGFSEVLHNPGMSEQQSGGSRFKQWFNHGENISHSNSSANSRSNSRRSSIVDEIAELAGLLQRSRSPSPVPAYMFAPITSPADAGPSILEMLNNANINVQPLLDSVISQQREAEEISKQVKVKGRIRLEDLENSPKVKGETRLEDLEGAVTKDQQDASAFLSLVGDMKAKGRLPERPSPTIPGLPVHFLPCPPEPKEKGRRSPKDRPPSPLDMIERAFARSQSPVNRSLSPVNGPLPTMGRAMSPIGMPVQNSVSPIHRQGSPIPNRINSPFGMLSSPIVGSPQDLLGQGMLIPGHISPPVDMLAQQLILSDMSPMRASPPIHRPSPTPPNRERGGPMNRSAQVSQYHTTRPFNNTTPRQELHKQNKPHVSSSVKNSCGIPTAFTPTAVLRKLHNDKQEQKQIKDVKPENEDEIQALPGSPVLQQVSRTQSVRESENQSSKLQRDDMLSPQRQPLFHVPDIESKKEKSARTASTPDISPHLPLAPPNTPQSSTATSNSFSVNNTPLSMNLMHLIQNKNVVNTPHSLPLPNSPLTPHSLPLPETPRPRQGINSQHNVQTPHSLPLPETPQRASSPHSKLETSAPYSLHNAHMPMSTSTPPNTPQNENLRRASQKMDGQILLSPDSFIKNLEKHSRSASPQQQQQRTNLGASQDNILNSVHDHVHQHPGHIPNQYQPNSLNRPLTSGMTIKQRPPHHQEVMHSQEQRHLQDQKMFNMQAHRYPMKTPVRSVPPQQRRSSSPHVPQQFPGNRGPFPMHLMQRSPSVLNQMNPSVMMPGVMRYPPSQADLHHLQTVAIQRAYAAQALLNRQQHQMSQQAPSPAIYNMLHQQGMSPQQRPMMNVPLPMNQRFPSGMSQERAAPSKDNSLSKWFGEDILKNVPQHHNHIPSGATPGRRVISVEELERHHSK